MGECSIEELVISIYDILSFFATSGPSVQPLPPSTCYGSMKMSSDLLESLGASADAVAAAAKDLKGPVKVLLPAFPPHAGAGLFNLTMPAKVTTGDWLKL